MEIDLIVLLGVYIFYYLGLHFTFFTCNLQQINGSTFVLQALKKVVSKCKRNGFPCYIVTKHTFRGDRGQETLRN